MSHKDYEDRTDPTGAEWDRQANAADDRNDRDAQTEFEKRMAFDDNVRAIGETIDRLRADNRTLKAALRYAIHYLSAGGLVGSHADRKAADLLIANLKGCQ